MQLDDSVFGMIGLPLVYHALGQANESDAALAELIEKHEQGWAYNIAYVFAYRGQAGRAFLIALPLHAAHSLGHGISLYGELKYDAGFTHFEYTNPDAPKGGALTLASRGSFDSLNPFILKGIAPPLPQID